SGRPGTARRARVDGWIRTVLERELRPPRCVRAGTQAGKGGLVSSTEQGQPPSEAAVDREIVVSRVIDARREVVFEAFTDVRHLSRWWGPEGFTTTTRQFEFRVGGVWAFTMRGPDGTEYPEWITWTGLTPPE